MNDKERNTDYTKRIPSEERLPPEEFTVHLTDPMLYDRLHILSMEEAYGNMQNLLTSGKRSFWMELRHYYNM